MKQYSFEEFLHIQGIQARSSPHKAQTSDISTSETASISVEPFVPKFHFLNKRIKVLVDASMATDDETKANIRLTLATYTFGDQKVTVLVKAAKIASLAMNSNTEDHPLTGCSYNEYRCLYSITRLEKVRSRESFNPVE